MDESSNVICKDVQRRRTWHARGTKLCSERLKPRVKEIELSRGQIMEYLKVMFRKLNFILNLLTVLLKGD